MADVTIKYKGATIAEMSGTSEKTLETGGTYCEGDIDVVYAPRTKTYEITLAKASGWVLLTTLDAEVLEHINDPNLVVTLTKISAETQEKYCLPAGFATNNNNLGMQGNYPIYGACWLITGDTTVSMHQCYYPANNTGSNTGLGGRMAFRLNGSQYYVNAIKYYVHAGTYRLTFTW